MTKEEREFLETEVLRVNVLNWAQEKLSGIVGYLLIDPQYTKEDAALDLLEVHKELGENTYVRGIPNKKKLPQEKT